MTAALPWQGWRNLLRQASKRPGKKSRKEADAGQQAVSPSAAAAPSASDRLKPPLEKLRQVALAAIDGVDAALTSWLASAVKQQVRRVFTVAAAPPC